MANYQIIRRLEILIHLLKSFPKLTKQNILDRLERDYDILITARTLERDFKALSDDMGIEICYDRSRNSYYLEEEDNESISQLLNFAGRIFLGDLLREVLKDRDYLKNTIQLKDHSNFEGILHLHPILSAINKKLDIEFIHENFQTEAQTKYRITPFLLREYRGRWYVVGLPSGEEEIRTFGLERLSALKMLGISTVKRKNYQSQLEQFDKIIGLNYNEGKEREIIELAVTPEQYKYLKTLPIHPSQTEKGLIQDGRMQVNLFLKPNYELIQELLRLNARVEVLLPAHLRNKIKRLLDQTLKQYQNGKKSN